MNVTVPPHSPMHHEWKNIQMLRMVAALMVVVFHATQQNTSFSLPAGRAGVDVFFAISGFVMLISTQQLRKSPDAPGRFIKRRLIRILPLYWAVTVVALLLYSLHGGASAKSMRLAYIVGSFFLVPVWRTLPPGNAGWHPVVNPGWTLSFEMLFYLLFALTIRTRQQVLWLSLTLGSLVLAGFALQPEKGWAVLNLLNPRLLEFLGGVLIAHAMLRNWVLRAWMSWLIVATFLASVLLLPLTGAPWLYGPLGIFGTLLVYAAASLENLSSRLAPRWGLFLGNCSYSIYLSHTLTILILWLLLRHSVGPGLFGELVRSLISVAVSIALGCLLSVYVEFPLHRALMSSVGSTSTTKRALSGSSTLESG